MRAQENTSEEEATEAAEAKPARQALLLRSTWLQARGGRRRDEKSLEMHILRVRGKKKKERMKNGEAKRKKKIEEGRGNTMERAMLWPEQDSAIVFHGS